jgi:biopolymer transport protein TolR
MSMAVGKKKGVTAEINITPYIDILLVLLIIFMTVAPMKPLDHKIRIPQPAPANMPKEVQQDNIIVEMDLDHTVKLNNQPMTFDKLEATLTAVFSRRAAKGMFIRGDTALPYGDIFQILDIAKRSGAKDIALIEMGYKKDTPVAVASQGSR